MQFEFGNTVMLTSEQIETLIAGMRSHLPNAVITLRADALHFSTGQGLIDFARQTSGDISPNDVKQ